MKRKRNTKDTEPLGKEEIMQRPMRETLYHFKFRIVAIILHASENRDICTDDTRQMANITHFIIYQISQKFNLQQ